MTQKLADFYKKLTDLYKKLADFYKKLIEKLRQHLPKKLPENIRQSKWWGALPALVLVVAVLLITAVRDGSSTSGEPKKSPPISVNTLPPNGGDPSRYETAKLGADAIVKAARKAAGNKAIDSEQIAVAIQAAYKVKYPTEVKKVEVLSTRANELIVLTTYKSEPKRMGVAYVCSAGGEVTVQEKACSLGRSSSATTIASSTTTK